MDETATETHPAEGNLADFRSLREMLPHGPASSPQTGISPTTSWARANCSYCFGSGRMRIPGHFQNGNIHTAPCRPCVQASMGGYNWRGDPSFGGCPTCGDLEDIDPDDRNRTIPHDHSAYSSDAAIHPSQRGEQSVSVQAETPDQFAVQAHVPLLFRESRIDTWEPADGSPRYGVLFYAQSWPMPKPVLVLTGGRGTGKTHLAIGAMFEIFRLHGKRSRFWPVVDLLDRYRATFDADRATESAADIDAEMRRTPVVVLDDLGAHKGTDWAEERLFRLVDERYRDRKPLIVTTNLALMEIPDRVRSRLGEGVVIQFRGSDRRLSS